MPRLAVWMVQVSLLSFGVGFTLGALILAQKGADFAPGAWRWWPVHQELTLIGWMVQLAMGVAFWILPRRTRTERYGNTTPAWIAFGLLNAGIAAVCLAGWDGDLPSLAAAGRLAELLAVITFAMYLWPRIKPFGG